MWRKAAGYVHPLWQEIYIGHISWENPHRSLIEAGLWIQGSHDIDTPKWNVTWLGRKEWLFLYCLQAFELRGLKGYLKSTWPRSPLLVFSHFLFDCVRGIVKTNQDVSVQAILATQTSDFTPIDTPLVYSFYLCNIQYIPGSVWWSATSHLMLIPLSL